MSCHVAKSPSGEIGFLVVVDDEFSELKQILPEQFSHDNEVLSMVEKTLHFKDVILVALSRLSE